MTTILKLRPSIPEARAARRFEQMAALEREIGLLAAAIAESTQHLKGLRDQQAGLVQELRAAARDEGELPWFDLFDAPDGALEPHAGDHGDRDPSVGFAEGEASAPSTDGDQPEAGEP
jgi:hypothetical protein